MFNACQDPNGSEGSAPKIINAEIYPYTGDANFSNETEIFSWIEGDVIFCCLTIEDPDTDVYAIQCTYKETNTSVIKQPQKNIVKQNEKRQYVNISLDDIPPGSWNVSFQAYDRKDNSSAVFEKIGIIVMPYNN
jgi:hypothetical protein